MIKRRKRILLFVVGLVLLVMAIAAVRDCQFRWARDRAVRCAGNLFRLNGAGMIYLETAGTSSVETVARIPTVEELRILLPHDVRSFDPLCPEGHHYVVTLVKDSDHGLLVSCPISAHNDHWLGPELWTELNADQRHPIEKRLRSRLALFPSSAADFLVLALVVITMGLGCLLPRQHARKVATGR